MAPVARTLDARGARPRLILTGQHPDLDPDEFGLSGFAADRLHIAGEENPDRHVGRVDKALRPLLRPRSDLLVVQGDTSSALGAALAGFAAAVPVAHVEAGLRTHDRNSPWPEEDYRTAIDARAALLFAPTYRAGANLAAEGVPGAVHVTGNSGIDAALMAEARLPAPSLRETGATRILVTCHRRESWGSGLESIAEALAAIARDRAVEIEVVLHPNPHVSATMTRLLGDLPAIRLVPPCDHDTLVGRMRDADLVLSDSGGIQEEAPALGVPLLVLRDKTERLEGVEHGNAVLVGTEVARIVAEVRRLIDDPVARAAMSRRSFPYGDGHSAPRIAALIEDWLTERRAMADARVT